MGRTRTRTARDQERAGIPTLREAFEAEVEIRLPLDGAYGGPRMEGTMQNHRAALDRHIGALAEIRTDESDHRVGCPPSTVVDISTKRG